MEVCILDKNQIEQILIDMKEEDSERLNKRMQEKSRTRRKRKGKRLHVEKLMRSCKGYNIFEKLIEYDTYSFKRGCQILTYIISLNTEKVNCILLKVDIDI